MRESFSKQNLHIYVIDKQLYVDDLEKFILYYPTDEKLCKKCGKLFPCPILNFSQHSQLYFDLSLPSIRPWSLWYLAAVFLPFRRVFQLVRAGWDLFNAFFVEIHWPGMSVINCVLIEK